MDIYNSMFVPILPDPQLPDIAGLHLRRPGPCLRDRRCGETRCREEMLEDMMDKSRDELNELRRWVELGGCSGAHIFVAEEVPDVGCATST